MSIIWTLRKYIDSIEQREEDAAQKRDREVARRPRAGGSGDDDPSKEPPPPPLRQCRVCGLRTRELYCTTCLADTLEPITDEEAAEPTAGRK